MEKTLVTTTLNILSVFLSMYFFLYMYMLQKDINKNENIRTFSNYLLHKIKVLHMREILLALIGFMVFLLGYLTDSGVLRFLCLIFASVSYAYVFFLKLIKLKLEKYFIKFMNNKKRKTNANMYKRWCIYLLSMQIFSKKRNRLHKKIIFKWWLFLHPLTVISLYLISLAYFPFMVWITYNFNRNLEISINQFNIVLPFLGGFLFGNVIVTILNTGSFCGENDWDDGEHF